MVEKTNVMRLLDSRGVSYISHTYEPDPTRSGEEIAALLTECYGFRFDGEKGDPMTLTDSEIEGLKQDCKNGALDDRARRLMQDRAGVGWTSGAHTGLPALTTSSGPCADRFTGLLDNTDISKTIKSFW